MPSARSRLGTRGEGVAREYLEARGYEIVSTNYSCQWGEVDIIARDGDCLVFVEVRTRTGKGQYGAPEESISKRKRDRLIATAETYIQSCPTPLEEWRIDLVALHLDIQGALGRVNHIENAIQLS